MLRTFSTGLMAAAFVAGCGSTPSATVPVDAAGGEAGGMRPAKRRLALRLRAHRR